jgi:hypothetical protein
MSLYPHDDKGRKALPVFKMITGYFPKALREITRVCVVNNVRYNPNRAPADINWARDKSTDQLGALYRHITEYVVDGTVFENVPAEITTEIGAMGFSHVYVLAEAAWRALAALELCIEAEECKVPFKPLIAKDGKLPGTPLIAESGILHSCCGGDLAIGHKPGCIRDQL